MINNWQSLLNVLVQNNWQQLLEAKPRCINIKQCPYKDVSGNLLYPELYMLSYDGIESDFNDPVVRCCRGSIVSLADSTNPQVVCQTFLKFGNFGESYCPEIDWSTAKVQDKRDGCLIKLFNYKDNWIWVTNNGWNIDLVAKEIAMLPSKFEELETDDCVSFMDLINYSMNKVNFDYTILEKNYTYMFELCSPKLRILVDNPKTELVYLGSRNNNTTLELTLEEAYAVNPELQKLTSVEYFDLHTMDDTLALCNSYNDDTKEGVVICDKNFNRIKIKCKHYVELKCIRNSTATKEDKIFDAIVENTSDDLLGAFPEIISIVDSIKQDYTDYLKYLKWHIDNAKKNYLKIKQIDKINPKKAFATWVLNNYPKQSHIYFKAIDLYYNINYDMIQELKESGDLYKIGD